MLIKVITISSLFFYQKLIIFLLSTLTCPAPLLDILVFLPPLITAAAAVSYP